MSLYKCDNSYHCVKVVVIDSTIFNPKQINTHSTLYPTITYHACREYCRQMKECENATFTGLNPENTARRGKLKLPQCT